MICPSPRRSPAGGRAFSHGLSKRLYRPLVKSIPGGDVLRVADAPVTPAGRATVAGRSRSGTSRRLPGGLDEKVARIVAGVAGTALAAAVTFAQAPAPQQPPAGRQGAPGAQAPAACRTGAGSRRDRAAGAAAAAAAIRPAAAQPMSFFVTSVGKGDGGESRRTGWRGCPLRGTCKGVRGAAGDRPHVARLSERDRRQRTTGRQRTRPHRHRSLAQRDAGC